MPDYVVSFRDRGKEYYVADCAFRDLQSAREFAWKIMVGLHDKIDGVNIHHENRLIMRWEEMSNEKSSS